ncbi:MAG: bifunctional phosphopantothenoylcysteine decarboxylase/phosphopantothenate--cysteine ligase CoaBC [Hyphomicrobium sp.]
MSERILLIIGGGIAAYKSLDLIRRLKEREHEVRVVLTRAALEFVTPLSAGALSNDRIFVDLFDLKDEQEIGHIRLSREASLIVVAPATADLLAKMAGGHANDLATAVLLATNTPVLVAPAMNPKMWYHPATQRNVAQLKADGINFIGPNVGEMAEPDEVGVGRMSEPLEIAEAVDVLFSQGSFQKKGKLPLLGKHVLVTSGPTREAIDPVRFITNHSSGKQGYAIAEVASQLGARVTLISGPVTLPRPRNIEFIAIETAEEMLWAVRKALPADVAIFAAAVADWKLKQPSDVKLKKTANEKTLSLSLTENEDILKKIATSNTFRPPLVIGFAAETDDLIQNAQRKRKDKGADWIVANDVSHGTETFGGDHNTVHLITSEEIESWPKASKKEVAERLLTKAAQFLKTV